MRLTQNSLLKIHSSVPVNLTLNSKWRDDGIIELEQFVSDKRDESEVGWNINVQDGKKIGLSSVNVSIFRTNEPSSVKGETTQFQDIICDENTYNDTESLTLTATIPEKCNVQCLLDEGGNIVVHGKLEAEDGFSFITNGGSITADKLRGDDIHLESKRGDIHIKKACEAQNLHISVGGGGRLRAKMLNVANANVNVQSCGDKFTKLDDDDSTALIDISSIFTSQSGEGVHLTVENSLGNCVDESIRKVRVKSSHGHLSVRSISQFSKLERPIKDEYGQNIAQVELGGVNGSFDVSVENQTEDYGIESDVSNLPMAAKVHVDSLSPNQANILTSDIGNVSLTLDRKLESDVRFISTKFVKKLDPTLLLDDDELTVIESLTGHDQYVEEENQNQKDVSTEEQKISIMTGAFKETHKSRMKHVEYIQGLVENVSQEPDSRFDVKTKGTMSVGKIRTEGAANQALHGFSGGKSLEFENNTLPLLCIATDGKICVESLSWLGAISRRYGITREHADLGRQANAGGTATKFQS